MRLTPAMALSCALKEILRELALHERIEEQFRVEEVFAEILDNFVRAIGCDAEPEFQQRLRTVQHRFVSHLRRLRDIARFELQLRFKNFALAGHQFEIDGEDDFAGALADTDISDGELARIAPIAVERRVVIVRGDRGELVDHLLAFGFADALDEGLESFVGQALGTEAGR